MEQTISLVMDVIILVALAVTIYYAVRLSRSLNMFRQYRQEFSNVWASSRIISSRPMLRF